MASAVLKLQGRKSVLCLFLLLQEKKKCMPFTWLDLAVCFLRPCLSCKLHIKATKPPLSDSYVAVETVLIQLAILNPAVNRAHFNEAPSTSHGNNSAISTHRDISKSDGFHKETIKVLEALHSHVAVMCTLSKTYRMAKKLLFHICIWVLPQKNSSHKIFLKSTFFPSTNKTQGTF